MSRAAAEIEATAVVDAPPDVVFDFLCDLGNHWRLVDRLVTVVSLEGDPPDRAVVRLRGPLGVRRTVHTHVTASRAPRLLIGVAEMGETRALVSWTLAPHLGRHTRVRLAAEVERAGTLDRLLLACGGRAWMRRRFGYGLTRLAERFQPKPAPSPTPA